MNKENKNALFIQHFYFDFDELVKVGSTIKGTSKQD